MKAGGTVGSVHVHVGVRRTCTVLTPSGKTLDISSRQPRFRLEATANHRHDPTRVRCRSGPVEARADLFSMVDGQVVGGLGGW